MHTIVHCRTCEELHYDVKEDPARVPFVQSIDGVAEKVQVVNFTPGVFKLHGKAERVA